MKANKHTKEYYIASIDLLGMKDVIRSDEKDINLNRIYSIYRSWPTILEFGYYSKMKIRFFSDNFVIAIKADQKYAAKKLLYALSAICTHFLESGYKPRGGVSKGRFYIDDIFVWGEGLVDAYLIECKNAVCPRVVIDDEIIKCVDASTREALFAKDVDGKYFLNYLRSYGIGQANYLDKIEHILDWLIPEIDKYSKIENTESESEDNKKILVKLQWLLKYVQEQKTYWQNYGQ